mgnify:CR=1 FL=1
MPPAVAELSFSDLPAELDEQSFHQIGRAFVAYLKAKRIGVGRDMRLSSPSLAAAFIAGALSGTISGAGASSRPSSTHDAPPAARSAARRLLRRRC